MDAPFYLLDLYFLDLYLLDLDLLDLDIANAYKCYAGFMLPCIRRNCRWQVL